MTTLSPKELRAISISEMKRFNCRLKWYWSSAPPRGLGLAPIGGDLPELNFGRLVHKVLQLGYDTDRDFVKIYKSLVEEHRPKSVGLMQGTNEKFNTLLTDGIAILEGYKAWSDQVDKGLRFLATETNWKGIQIPGTRGNASVILDSLVERHDGLWVMDFKTTSFTSNPWTDQDLQATLYTHAARQLISPDVRGVIFRFILKKTPKPFTELILKNGTVTRRQNLPGLTTYEEYYKALAVMTYTELQGGEPLTSEEALEGAREEKDDPEFKKQFLNVRRMYYSEIESFKEEGNKFFWDDLQYRTPVQVENYLKYYVSPRMNEILNVKWIGPTGLDKAYAGCGKCPFRIPCKLKMDGADYKTILREDYQLSSHYQDESEADE